MLRRVMLFVFIALAIFSLNGLAAEKRLTVISGWSGPEMDAFMPVLKAFELETGIKVDYQIYRAEDLAVLLPAQFAAKTAPGDVIMMWGWFINREAQAGHVLDVTGALNEADFVPGVLDAVKSGNKLWGGSYTGKVKPGFWYRKSFFQKNGLSVPKTWDEFQALCAKIQKIPGIKAPIASGNGVGWPLSDITEHFISTYAGPEVSLGLMSGKVAWTDPIVRGVFEQRLVPMLKAHYFSEPIEWTMAADLWWSGDYGLYFMGSWITGMVKDPTDLGVFSLPGSKGIVFAPDYAFVPAYSKSPVEAKRLLAFLCTKGQEIQVRQGGHIATYDKVALDAYPPVDRGVADLMKGRVALPDLDDTIGGEWQPAFWDQLKLLWVSPARVGEVLDTLQRKMPK
ncbi:MAG: ABC transporter substrate-binding protein [Clostridia bacterium]|nr:ABC transporter substrate-binding protein [Clostridia bacterium]